MKKTCSQYGTKASWIIQFLCLFAGYCLFLTTFALIKTMGVFFIQLQMEFGASAAQASFTVTMPSTVVFMGGPIYGAIFNVMGIKPTLSLASCLIFLGYSACFFAQSLLFVQICFAFAGFGEGLANVAALTLMGRAFYTSRPLAMAALAMGGSTAGAVITPIMQLCINEYTWRGALLILGAYSLHGIACGFAIEPLYTTIVRKRRDALIARVLTDDSKNEFKDLESKSNDQDIYQRFERSKEPDRPQEYLSRKSRRKSSIYDRFSALGTNVVTAFDFNLLKDIWFVAYCISCGLSICSRVLSGLYLVRYAQCVGLSDQQAAQKLTICESVALFVMPVVATITSVKRDTSRRKELILLRLLRRAVSSLKRSVILGTFQILMGVVIVMSTTLNSSKGMSLYAALLGMCYGGITFLTNAVLADLFGSSRLPGALGYRSLCTGIFFLSTPYAIGALVDLSGSYKIAQYFTSAMTFVAGILTIITQLALRRRNNSAIDDDVQS